MACPECGELNPANARFCMNCGKSITPLVPTPPPFSAFAEEAAPFILEPSDEPLSTRRRATLVDMNPSREPQQSDEDYAMDRRVSELYYQMGTELGNDHLNDEALLEKARNTALIERDNRNSRYHEILEEVKYPPRRSFARRLAQDSPLNRQLDESEPMTQGWARVVPQSSDSESSMPPDQPVIFRRERPISPFAPPPPLPPTQPVRPSYEETLLEQQEAMEMSINQAVRRMSFSDRQVYMQYRQQIDSDPRFAALPLEARHTQALARVSSANQLNQEVTDMEVEQEALGFLDTFMFGFFSPRRRRH